MIAKLHDGVAVSGWTKRSATLAGNIEKAFRLLTEEAEEEELTAKLNKWTRLYETFAAAAKDAERGDSTKLSALRATI
jgi:hypothetical protein